MMSADQETAQEAILTVSMVAITELVDLAGYGYLKLQKVHQIYLLKKVTSS